jgi:hypothetical protein
MTAETWFFILVATMAGGVMTYGVYLLHKLIEWAANWCDQISGDDDEC